MNYNYTPQLRSVQAMGGATSDLFDIMTSLPAGVLAGGIAGYFGAPYIDKWSNKKTACDSFVDGLLDIMQIQDDTIAERKSRLREEVFHLVDVESRFRQKGIEFPDDDDVEFALKSLDLIHRLKNVFARDENNNAAIINKINTGLGNLFKGGSQSKTAFDQALKKQTQQIIKQQRFVEAKHHSTVYLIAQFLQYLNLFIQNHKKGQQNIPRSLKQLQRVAKQMIQKLMQQGILQGDPNNDNDYRQAEAFVLNLGRRQ